MKVSELIERLNALPQDANVLVPAHDDCHGAYWDEIKDVQFREVEMFSGEKLEVATLNELYGE